MKYFDLHCDTATKAYSEKGSIYSDSLSGTEIFEEWYQCFAIWIKDGLCEAYEYYRSVLDYLKVQLAEKPDNLTPIITVEGGAVIGRDIKRVEQLYLDGVRAITLTWNGKNAIACGCRESGGLTAFGREVIAEMNRLNIACDLSHLNEESFWDALELSKHPFASHSCANQVFPHQRNLNDNQLKAIAEKGGIIGICPYPEFLGCEPFEGVYLNIRHLLSLGLDEHIAFGSDFDGADMSKNLDKASKIPDLAEFLSHKGLDFALIGKIFYNNSKNFLVCL